MPRRIVIGTRGSRLALWQANWVKSEIEKRFPGTTADLDIIKTKGDKILDVPLAKVGGKGLFVKEIEDALIGGRIDLAVHSMKDMPARLPRGLAIGAIPERENPWDVLIASNHLTLDKLPRGAAVGTSSLRRSAQLLYVRPDLVIRSLRGNLDTRLNKLYAENLDAIVLAAAGVIRMGLEDRITQYLEADVMMPAVGQGALCIESRAEDTLTAPLLEALDHDHTRCVVLGERAFLDRLGGGCQVPIAAHGRLTGGTFEITGLVASVDGATLIRETLEGPGDRSRKIGTDLAEILIDRGAERIIEALKTEDIITP